MSGFCDRCNEKASQLVKITNQPEMAPIVHLGYRQVCPACYDDLQAEAEDFMESEDDRRSEPRFKVNIKARVNGNTAYLQPFSDDTVIDEISPSGLRIRTARDLDKGSVMTVIVPEYSVETTAIVEVIWSDTGDRSAGLKLVEPSDEWEKLWSDKYSST